MARLHGEALRTWLSAPSVERDLTTYFAVGRPRHEVPPFTGGWFERLDGGGDRPEVVDVVTAADVLATEALSVRIPSEVALDLVAGRLGRGLSALLVDVPADVDLVDAGDDVNGEESAAWRAWDLLRGRRGVGWVVAGKLLARKRPRVIPVYDRVVRAALGWGDGFWAALRAKLGADDRALHRQLLQLREASGVPATVSALRVLDVALWMGHRVSGGSTGVQRVAASP